MFSDLPKTFDKNFVIGYLLPSIMIVLSTILLLWISFGLQLLDFNLNTTQNGKIVLTVSNIDSAVFLTSLLALVCIILAVTLLALNRILIRMLEGYLPPISWFRPIAILKYRKLLSEIEKNTKAYMDEQNQGNVSEATLQKYAKLLSQKANEFPDNEIFILSTRFGNVIRAAEVYPRILYGADIIPVWTRLLSVIDDKFSEYINGARASMDFAVNTFYACIFLFIEACALFTISRNNLIWQQYWWILVLLITGTGFSYSLAISRAIEWGSFIKSASDLYLADLLRKLGYDISETEKHKAWQKISRTFLYLEKQPPHITKKKLRK